MSQLTPAASGNVVRLRSSLAEAHAEIKELRRTVASQARLLSLLAPETSPAAPSLNCVYWLYAPTKWHSKSWRHEWNRLMPSIDRLGEMLAPDITPVVWERHRSERRRQEQRGGGTPCEHTLNIELARLKSLLDWAAASQMIKFNPLASASYVKTKSRRETELKAWDIDGMLVAAEDFRDRRLPEGEDDGRRSKQLTAFILLCFDSMLRFNEARKLRLDLIDGDGNYHVREAKGGKSRIVVLTERTREAVAALPRVPGTNYAFSSPDTGQLIGEQTMRGWWTAMCESSGVNARTAPGEPRVTPHHLRHAGATAADAAGARPGALQTTLGHANMRTTERYLHRESAESAKHVAEKITDATKLRRPPQRATKSLPTKK